VFWPSFAKHHQAIEVTPDELERWSLFSQEIDEALKAKTLDDAFDAVWNLQHSVGYLPYKDERHRQVADAKLKIAGDHLQNCYTARRDHPDFWRSRFSDALLRIPRYGTWIKSDEAAPPPVIDYAALNALE
jgi:hypothetical protein